MILSTHHQEGRGRERRPRQPGRGGEAARRALRADRRTARGLVAALAASRPRSSSRPTTSTPGLRDQLLCTQTAWPSSRAATMRRPPRPPSVAATPCPLRRRRWTSRSTRATARWNPTGGIDAAGERRAGQDRRALTARSDGARHATQGSPSCACRGASPAGSPAMTGRLVLLSTSPRVAPGLLSWHAWSVLREGRVVAADEHHPLLAYLRDADIDGRDPAPADDPVARASTSSPSRARRPARVPRRHRSARTTFARALHDAARSVLRRRRRPSRCCPAPTTCPAPRLLDLVATMDRLRSPGGCPWDAEQTHESLVTYLLEETYETIEAIETGDRDHLREELGDLLLQVMFHSRIAAEHTEQPLVGRRRRRRTSSTSWCAVIRTSSPTCTARTDGRARRGQAGRRSRRPRRAATRRSTACRWASRRWRSPPS